MAGFSFRNKSRRDDSDNSSNNSSKKGSAPSRKGAPKSGPKGTQKRDNGNKSHKSFNVNEEEIQSLRKRQDSEIVSKSDLQEMTEKVNVPVYIDSVKDCTETIFVHIINHSKVKNFDPFLIGKVDLTLSDLIDKCIKDSKEEFVPSDLVDLLDGDRIKNLSR